MPQINVRWSDNTKELATNLARGTTQLEATRASVDKLVKSFQGDNLIAAAHKWAVAIDQIGGITKLTAAEQQRANAIFEKAHEKLTLMGKGSTYAADQFRLLADQTKKVEQPTSALNTYIGQLGTNIVAAAAGFVTAQAIIATFRSVISGLSSELATLTLHGAAVSDVTDNFARLTSNAGHLGSTLLGTLRSGTRATITDFELMKTVNQDLAAGMNLTDQQFGTLAKGAFALAQATGGDVKSGLDVMNDAMLTGRTRALALLTGKIDLTAAEEKFAQSIGTTADKLSEEGKLEAARVAILDAVSAATERLGVQTDGLDERVAQAQVAWANFEDGLGRTIATSTVLEAGLVGIQDALTETFGPTQQALIDAIAEKVDEAAIALVSLGKVGVTSAGIVVTEYYAVKKIFGDLAQIIDGNRLAINYFSLAVNKAAAATSFGDYSKRFADEAKRINEEIGGLLVTMRERGKALQADDAAQAGVSQTTSHYTKVLDELQGKMAAAKSAHVAFVGPLQDVAAAQGVAGRTATDYASLVKSSTDEVIKAFSKMADELATKLALAAKAGTPMAQLLLELGDDAAKVVTAAQRIPGAFDRLPASIKAVAEAFTQAKIAKILEEIHAKSSDMLKSLGPDFVKAMQSMAAAANASLASVVLAGEKANEDLVIARKVGLDKQLAEIDRAEKAELAKYAQVPAGMEAIFAKETALVRAKFDDQRALSAKFTGDVLRDAAIRGIKSKQVLEEELRVERAVLAEMLANREQFTAKAIQQQREMVVAAGSALRGSLQFDLSALAKAFAQLSQIGGESFSGVVQAIGTAIGAVNVMQTSVKALNDAVTTGGKASWGQYAAAAMSAASVVTLGLNIMFDWIKKKNAETMAKFHEWSALLESTGNRLAAIQVDIPPVPAGTPKTIWAGSLEQIRILEAAQKKLWDAYATGSIDAIRAAAKEFDTLLTRYETIAAKARSQFGPSRADLAQSAVDAKAVLDYMTASSLDAQGHILANAQFTQEQLNKAYFAWQESLAATGDAAAKAWLAAQAGAVTGAAAVTTALSKLQKERDDLAKSIENEAPEEVMGVLEQQARARIAAIDEQIAASQRQAEADAEAAVAVQRQEEEAAAAAEVTAASTEKSVSDAADSIVSDMGTDVAGAIIAAASEFDLFGPKARNARDSIDAEFSGFSITIPVNFVAGTVPDAASAAAPQYAASGGTVRSWGLESWGMSGLSGPRGTDRVQTWLTPGETVRTPQQEAGVQSRLGGSVGGASRVDVHAHLSLDGHEVTSVVVTDVLQDKRGAGTKLRRGLRLTED